MDQAPIERIKAPYILELCKAERYSSPLITALATSAWGYAFINLDSWLAVIFGWFGAILLVKLFRQNHIWWAGAWIGGWSGFIVGFPWFATTMQRFTHWSSAWCIGAVLLFAAYGSLQIVGALWLARQAKQNSLSARILAFPLSWLLFEILFYRPIDWYVAYTQGPALVFIQIADLGGPPLVSFVMMLVASSIYEVAVSGDVRAKKHSQRIVALSIAISGLVIPLMYGAARIKAIDRASNSPFTISVALIAGNTEPSADYNAARMMQHAKYYGSLLQTVDPDTYDVALLPESSIGEPFTALTREEQEQFLTERFLAISKPLLSGIAAVHADDPDSNSENAVALIAPKVEQRIYKKQIPFPVAEGSLFASTAYLLGLTASRSESSPIIQVPISTQPKTVRIAPLICFESLSPLFVAQRAISSTPDLFVEFSNHNWFGDSSASHQHLHMARWRAVESRRPLVRVVNAGLNALITSDGRIQYTSSSYYSEKAQVISVPINLYLPTVFSRSGMIATPLLVMLVVAFFMYAAQAQRLFPVLRLAMHSHVTATMLGCIGLLHSAGVVFQREQILALGIASGASPNPFVFNRFRDVDYWANSSAVEILTTELRRVLIPLGPEQFGKLEGPHLYHMAIIIPFAFAPTYSESIWKPIVQKLLCSGTTFMPSFISNQLHPDEQVASAKFMIYLPKQLSELGHESVPEWVFRVSCSGALQP